MPNLFDDDDNDDGLLDQDFYEDESCDHCPCYEEGNTCCDCGDSSVPISGDEDDDAPYLSSQPIVCEDDGSEEEKD